MMKVIKTGHHDCPAEMCVCEFRRAAPPCCSLGVLQMSLRRMLKWP